MNKKRTISYVGISDNLKKTCIEHKSGVRNIYTKRNFIYDLVYFEHFDSYADAIIREKHLTLVSSERRKKMILLSNPHLADMAANWYTTTQIKSYQPGNMV